MSFFDDIGDFFSGLVDKLRGENEERRREDRSLDNELINIGVEEHQKILSVDLHPKENALTSNCEQYELVTRGKGEIIIRRGNNFQLTVTFANDVDLKHLHLLELYFNFGPRPLVNKGTRAVLTVSGKKSFDMGYDDWDQRVVSEEGSTAVIEVQTPPDTPVGIWKLALSVKSRDDEKNEHRYLKRLEQVVYILFNPWNKDDDVYLNSEEERKEYVLNDVGKVWVGGYPLTRGRQWVYGQFDDAVLPACVLLMEKSGLLPEQRDSPVLVSRTISRMVNSNDDNGVVAGRWEGSYGDGTAPSKWSGSIKILEQYLRTGRPVKYGQCWVFAGVVTTVCRALGLPCRTVSNLNSAHDTNMSLTIDKYFDKKGEKYRPSHDDSPTGYDDSIWNFHVWNDVWMTRPDLPHGFGGWQVIDSTPQERSETGLYQCGPASVEAVRLGQTHHNYDVNFVLAEINADVMTWVVDENAAGGFKKVSSDKRHVGRQVLTKALGEMDDDVYTQKDRQDITREYKAKEGSKAERLTLEHAARRTRTARHAFSFPSTVKDDIDFSLEDIDVVPIGRDFTIAVKLENNSDEMRSVSVVLCSSSQFYTGVKSKTIKKAEGAFEIDPGVKDTLKLVVDYESYFDKLVERAIVKIVAIADVKETKQTWIGEDTFEVMKPNIRIEIPKTIAVNTIVPVKFSFLNPLKTVLQDCVLVVDGPGLTRPKTIPLSPVKEGGEMTYELKIQPYKTGRKILVATFNSAELLDLTGSANVVIV